MLHSKLRKVFFKSRIEERKQRYNNQKNLSVTLWKKSKRDYLNDSDMKNICDFRK